MKKIMLLLVMILIVSCNDISSTGVEQCPKCKGLSPGYSYWLDNTYRDRNDNSTRYHEWMEFRSGALTCTTRVCDGLGQGYCYRHRDHLDSLD